MSDQTSLPIVAGPSSLPLQSKRRRTCALFAVMLIGLAGCSLSGVRRVVAEGEAREFLTQAVDLVASGETFAICDLSPFDASTCEDTLGTAGGVTPSAPPTVTCAVAIPDAGPLRHGMVLVVEGIDAIGDPYRTEFIVFDDGDTVGVLDAVYWSGLSVQDYGSQTVSWQFDSDSGLCETGELPSDRETDQPRSDGRSESP